MLRGFLFALLLILPPSMARDLVSDLSISNVEIRANFTGADLLLFGAIVNPDLARGGGVKDLIVVVRGPESPVVVRKKRRTVGVWINRDVVTFTDAPGFYAVDSTRPLSRIGNRAFLAHYRIGAQFLRLTPAESAPAAMVQEFQLALTRAMARTGLFSQGTEAISLRDDTLFKTVINLPSDVPSGSYRAEVYLLVDGSLKARDSVTLKVGKVGIERMIHDFAHRRSAWYGIMAIIIAVAAGWVAGLVSRK